MCGKLVPSGKWALGAWRPAWVSCFGRSAPDCSILGFVSDVQNYIPSWDFMVFVFGSWKYCFRLNLTQNILRICIFTYGFSSTRLLFSQKSENLFGENWSLKNLRSSALGSRRPALGARRSGKLLFGSLPLGQIVSRVFKIFKN